MGTHMCPRQTATVIVKKPKRSRHRIPNCALEYRSDPISEHYQAEVDAATAKLEARHRKALMALEAADRRAERIRRTVQRTIARAAKNKARHEQRKLEMAVEEREAELCQIEKLMVPSTYASRDSRRRVVRMESGTITIPLGALAGSKPRPVAPTLNGDHVIHALYRHFDSQGQLLYVGITIDPGGRTKTHARQKRWWLEEEVSTMTIEYLSSREAVKRAELHAIQTENPKYNIAGKITSQSIA